MRRSSIVGAAISLLLITALPVRGQALYSIEDIGVLPGGSFSQAHALSSEGQVVGFSSSATGIHAFQYGRSGLVDLGVIPGGTSSIAYSINDEGKIVGQSGTAATPRAFLYQGGVMSSLGVLPGGTVSFASDINNAAEVVGYSNTGTTASHAFVYRDGLMTDLVGPLGSTSSQANAINDRGDIVGTYTSAGTYGSFIYSGGVFQLLPQLPNGATATAVDLNTFGQITGTFGTSASYHAFSFSDGVMTDLGAFPGGLFSVGRAINDAGAIVGEAAIRTGGFRAALFATGGPIDLNTLVLNGSEWSLDSATGINGSGQISGFGTFGGVLHAFLLTPIPEPSTYALMVAGLLPLAWRMRCLPNERRGVPLAPADHHGRAAGPAWPGNRRLAPALRTAVAIERGAAQRITTLAKSRTGSGGNLLRWRSLR